MIEELITSKARRNLLTLFLTNPKTRFYMRELARKTGAYIHSVRQELNKLEGIGLIKSEKVANLKYYSVNEGCIIYDELRNIIAKTSPAEAVIRHALDAVKQRFGEKLSSVILFGSYARNELRFNDIDLLVIVKELPEDWRKRDEIIIEMEKTVLSSGIPIHMELITSKEFEFSVNEGAPLLLELSLAYKIIYDNGFFRKNIESFKENMLRWKAKKTGNVWEVPELAVKI